MKENKENTFYLGRVYDPGTKETLETPLRYNPADLTTHAIVTGMTGSGKTGLCTVLLEEAALQGIPAIIIDPKGDLTNLMLHFPDLQAQSFQPWVDPEEARRQKKTTEEFAEQKAVQWKEGLTTWGLNSEQIAALSDAADFTVYTPGSSAGQPINILSSFEAPDVPWDTNREVLREKISAITTALLGLIGLKEIDPLRSREHILIANLIEIAWSQAQSLNLNDLILQVQKPPLERLGAFPLESFFPDKDRMELALLLNNFLAAPSFQTWQEGQTLDIPTLLTTEDGKPRHSIFYLAHLSESERMFFVTLLFAAIESWMRTQRGTSGLRALLYFDEILGYLPPVENPPAKEIMLRMLKQARAFGVGLLLATQNPVDVDYKALSNAGTWIIGRLQTERDKQRLVDGLQSAGGNLDIQEYERLISGLDKRVFLLHNVHAEKPQLFHSRWAMNFLAGPLTRAQIPALNQLKNAAKTSPTPATQPQSTTVESPPSQETTTTTAKPIEEYQASQPAAPSGIEDFFLPNELSVSKAISTAGLSLSQHTKPQGVLYTPALFAQLNIYYYAKKYNLEHTTLQALLLEKAVSGKPDWEQHTWHTLDLNTIDRRPLPEAYFTPLPGWLSQAKELTALKRDLLDWVYRSATIYLRVNEALNIAAGPDTSSGSFREMCSEAARQALDEDIKKAETGFDKKITALTDKINRQQSEVEEQEEELNQRKMEEFGAGGELLISLFNKRKRSVSKTLTKHRLTQQAKIDLEQELLELETLEKNFKDIQNEKTASVEEIENKWAQIAKTEEKVPLNPYKKDIHLDLFGIAWLPHYLFDVDGNLTPIAAYQQL